MTPCPAQRISVVHSGALGDSILIWPLLRALAAQGSRVVLVTQGTKGPLAAREIGHGLRSTDGDSALWSALWADRTPGLSSEDACDLLINLLVDEDFPAGERWVHNARAMTGVREVLSAGAHGTTSRRDVWTRFDVGCFGRVPPRHNSQGPILMHIGAGSRSKRWSIERWDALAAGLRQNARWPLIGAHPPPIIFLAGQADAEQFLPPERGMFEDRGGVIPASLFDLAELVRSASLYIGHDTGPTHLAAQLGVPTLALFGPTDASIWRPVGPLARIIAPPREHLLPADMSWLEVDQVVQAAISMLHS